MFEIPASNGLPGPGERAGSGNLTIRSLAQALIKRLGLILTGILTVFSLVAFLTFSQTPLYSARSVLQLDTTQVTVIDLGALFSGAGGGTTSVIDTEIKVMQSEALLARVADAQRLIEDPEFNWRLREPERGPVATIRQGLSAFLGGGETAPDPFASLSEAERQEQMSRSVVAALAGKIRVTRVGATYLLTVEASSTSPDTAARLANEVTEQYRVQRLEKKYDATRKATEWLQERVEGLRSEVEEKEQQVERFRSETGLLAAQGTTLTEQQLAYLTSQRGQAQLDAERARARFQSMRRQIDIGPGVEGVSEVINAPLINELKAKRSEIMRRVAELETRVGDRHPELISARNELTDIDRQMNSEMNRIASNVESELRVAEAQLASVQREIDRATSQLRGNNVNLVRLRELERDAQTSRVMLEEFLARSKQTREQDALITADSSILSQASPPGSPSSPRKLLNLIIGLILGGVTGLGLALLAELFDNKISSNEEIEVRLGANPLGSVPLIPVAGLLGIGRKIPPDYLVENSLSAYAESIRYLRAAIAFSDLDGETKTVAITSSLPDEGKTSLTLSLGRMSAMSGSRALIIDGDFRRRQLTEMAGLDPTIGMVEHLFGAGALADALIRDRMTTLDILPLSLKGHTPHDIFGTRAFDELLTHLRSLYDLILIDTGPLLLMAEARVIAGKADKSILIVGWRKTNLSAVRQSLALLRSFKADLLGVTLNMVDLNNRRHNADPGATYKAYRKYYQVDDKPGLFGWIRRRAGKARPGRLRPAVSAKAAPGTSGTRPPARPQFPGRGS
jgi:polysaccharide biosynthesis transport protein